MAWMECVCARSSKGIRMMLIGTVTYADTWLLEQAFAAAELIGENVPVILDLSRLDHLCPSAYWELERLLAVRGRRGARTVVEGWDVSVATACRSEPPRWQARLMADLELDRRTEEALPVAGTAA